MSGGIGEVDFVLAVAPVLGVRPCASALDNLLGSEVERAVVVLVRHRQTCNRRMPVDAAPAEVNVRRVIAQDEGRRIGRVVGRGEVFLLAQGGDVAGLAGDAVPYLGLVGVARVEDHHALVRQHDERRVVVVVGLEVAADEYLRLATRQPVVLCSLHVAMHVDVAEIGGVDGAGSVLVVERARVGKPAPGSFVGHNGAAVALLCPG